MGVGSLALPPIPNLEDQGVTLLLDLFGMGGPTKLPHHDKLVTPFGAQKSIMYT